MLFFDMAFGYFVCIAFLVFWIDNFQLALKVYKSVYNGYRSARRLFNRAGVFNILKLIATYKSLLLVLYELES